MSFSGGGARVDPSTYLGFAHRSSYRLGGLGPPHKPKLNRFTIVEVFHHNTEFYYSGGQIWYFNLVSLWLRQLGAPQVFRLLTIPKRTRNCFSQSRLPSSYHSVLCNGRLMRHRCNNVQVLVEDLRYSQICNAKFPTTTTYYSTRWSSA